MRPFRSLLGVRRLFGVDDPETLDGLFERSRDDEREVTDQLGIQARRAVELLVAAFDRADRESGGQITEGIRKLERNEEAKADRRQSAAGQVAGMIQDIVPVRDLIEDMLAEAASLAARMPAIAARQA